MAEKGGSKRGHLDEADPDEVNAAMAQMRKDGTLKDDEHDSKKSIKKRASKVSHGK